MNRGSYPTSVVPLEALWMLELASQLRFRECARHHVSTPGVPGNVEGGGFFDSLGRNAGFSQPPALAPETKSVRAFLDSREGGRGRGFVGPRKGAPRHGSGLPRLWATHNSLIQNPLSAVALLGQESGLEQRLVCQT